MQPPSNPQPKSQGELWCRTWSKNVALRRAGSWVRIRVRPCVNHRGRRKSEVAVRRETALHPLEPQSQSCCGWLLSEPRHELIRSRIGKKIAGTNARIDGSTIRLDEISIGRMSDVARGDVVVVVVVVVVLTQI